MSCKQEASQTQIKNLGEILKGAEKGSVINRTAEEPQAMQTSLRKMMPHQSHVVPREAMSKNYLRTSGPGSQASPIGRTNTDNSLLMHF